ncbi:MAG: porin family protein [Pseudomonas sp.]
MFKKTLLAAIVMGSMATGVQAAEQVNGYLFGSLGQSDADVSKQTLDDYWGVGPGMGISSSLDTKDTAFKIGAGIQLNAYVGIELQYIDLGEVSYKATDGFAVAKTTAETDGFGMNVVGTLPLDRLSLFGKVGYHQLKTELKDTVNIGFSESDSEKENLWSWGIGAAYALNESFSVVAEFERYRDVADTYDVDFLSAGLRYNF